MNYVVAVSGGVDSIVLLNALANKRLHELNSNFQLPTSNFQLIVAHFDHGIRNDSSSDQQFTRGVAGEYGLPYETERAELGAGASENTAREARYNFLRQVCNKYKALLLTAHHQDDVIETIIINLIRGTNWRGLAPMADQILDLRSSSLETESRPTSRDQPTIRPLINTPKASILQYAKKYQLQWQEDSTNNETKYLRNYIRLKLIPEMLNKDPGAISKLLKINQTVINLKKEIAKESQNYLSTFHLPPSTCHLPRYTLIMLPSSVAQELIYVTLTTLDPNWHPGALQVRRVLHFAKTAQPGKVLEVSGGLLVQAEKSTLQFKNT